MKPNIEEMLRQLHQVDKERREYLEKKYPTNIPNEVCNHALLKGVNFENSFNPKQHEFERLMEISNEEVYIWTHTKDTYTSLISIVSEDVKVKKLWKNIASVIELAYSYSTDFESTMDLEYKWFYYFDSKTPIFEHKIYNHDPIDDRSLSNGIILKITDLYSFSPIIELLIRDDRAFTAMSAFYSSMQSHYCCLICELNRYYYAKHPSHEPKLWEQASVISNYEVAIVQACRCVEALLGNPPNRANKKRFSEHKEKWISLTGINPDESFPKSDNSYIDFYYKLFKDRNSAAHSFGTIPFDLERRNAVEAQCFAFLLLEGYVHENVLERELVIDKLNFNQDILSRVRQDMSTKRTNW